VGIDAGSNLLGSTQIAPATNRTSPEVSLLSLEPIQIAPVGVDVGSDLVGLAEIALSSLDVPFTNLAVLEVAQISPVMIDAGSFLMGSTQIVPETILTSTEASKINLTSPELAQIVPVGVEEVPVLVGVAGKVPDTQFMFELGQISPEMAQSATVGVAGEKGVLRWGFLLRRSFRVVPGRTVASVVRGKHFSFPPVLEDAPTFSIHSKGSSGSKSTLRREAIQLYRISHRELEKRLSIACSVYFVDKGGVLRFEVRDVG
jgi:hypothetical protein